MSLTIAPDRAPASAVVFPSPESAADIAGVQSALDSLVRTDGVHAVTLTLASGERLVVPTILETLLRDAATILSSGRGVALSPVARELTTTEAANLLGISRPTLGKLLNEDKLPFRHVGRHRRVLLDDVLAFRRAEVDRQRAAYEELRRDAAKLER